MMCHVCGTTIDRVSGCQCGKAALPPVRSEPLLEGNTVKATVRQCLVCGGPMRERVRRETWNRDGKPPILVPIAKCKKCWSWVNLPNAKAQRPAVAGTLPPLVGLSDGGEA